MLELVDRHGSGPCVGNRVGVRVSPRALSEQVIWVKGYGYAAWCQKWMNYICMQSYRYNTGLPSVKLTVTVCPSFMSPFIIARPIAVSSVL